MGAAKRQILIEQGSTFQRQLTCYADRARTTPVNLTGWTGRGKIKATPDSGSAVATFTVTFASDRTTGRVTFSMGVRT